MTATNSIPKFFKSVQLDDKKACLSNQISRQRHIPPSFLEGLPLRPYCTNNLKHGLAIRPRQTAVKKPYIEINPPALVSWLVFDIDRDNAAFAWQDVFGLKAPHLAIINQSTGHAHLWYKLSVPVCRSEAGHLKPLEYLAAIQRTYTSLLGADPGFAGLISKNPLHPAHGLIIFRPLSKPYALAELAANVDLLPKPRKSEVVHGLGRNCTVFEEARNWAYVAIRSFWRPGGLPAWKEAVMAQSDAINEVFAQPLPVSEIRSISESIAGWTWKHTTPSGFHSSQKAKGIRSGIARRSAKAGDREKANELATQGLSQKVIAETMKVNTRTIRRWLQS